MITNHKISLALSRDAPAISVMSRDYVERGLGWDWTATRVLRSIRDRSTNVAVVRDGGPLLGFGIMKYGDDTAHLHLLAVHRSMRRKGMGTALLLWLEQTARASAIERVRLEARASNDLARAFYRSRGYHETERLSGYYRGVEDAVRLEKLLWVDTGTGLVPE